MESQETDQEYLEKMVKDQEQSAQQSAAVPAASAVEYAGFWDRAGAVFVDGLVLLIPNAIVQGIFGKEVGNLLSAVLMWAYAIYMLSTRQATLGKMAVGLKVTTENGEKPTTGMFALREILGKTLNILTLFIGYLMIVFTQKKQGLHDKIAGTVVIYDPARKRRSWIAKVLIGFYIIVALLGILTAVVLVATSSARQKALEEKTRLEQKAKEIEQQLKEDEAKENEDAVYCTQDAKQCPDGSFVGRQAPTCEFAPCPEEK